MNDAERKFLPLEMKGFRFKRHKSYNLPVDRLHKIEDFLQKRAREISEYGVDVLKKGKRSKMKMTRKVMMAVLALAWATNVTACYRQGSRDS